MKTFRSLKSLWGAVVGLTLVGPLALWLPGLQPPWPTKAAPIATLFSAIAIILGLFVFESSKKSIPSKLISDNQPKHKLFIFGSLLLGLFLGTIYIYQYERFVIIEIQPTSQGKSNELRFIAGKELRDNIQITDETPKELLRKNDYEPELIWTKESLVKTRLSLLSSFCLTFFFLNFGLTLLAGNRSNGGGK